MVFNGQSITIILLDSLSKRVAGCFSSLLLLDLLGLHEIISSVVLDLSNIFCNKLLPGKLLLCSFGRLWRWSLVFLVFKCVLPFSSFLDNMFRFIKIPQPIHEIHILLEILNSSFGFRSCIGCLVDINKDVSPLIKNFLSFVILLGNISGSILVLVGRSSKQLLPVNVRHGRRCWDAGLIDGSNEGVYRYIIDNNVSLRMRTGFKSRRCRSDLVKSVHPDWLPLNIGNNISFGSHSQGIGDDWFLIFLLDLKELGIEFCQGLLLGGLLSDKLGGLGGHSWNSRLTTLKSSQRWSCNTDRNRFVLKDEVPVLEDFQVICSIGCLGRFVHFLHILHPWPKHFLNWRTLHWNLQILFQHL